MNTVAERANRRITRRLMPFLLLMYITAYLDRVNISYASLQMSRELGFSDEVFGFGAGIFFVGYLLLEIPGALLVEVWSARKWFARILISWGIIAALTSMITSAHQFYWVRFFLGVAESGFFPGVIVYLTHWFPYKYRGKAVAMFMTAVPFTNIIGAPVSGLLMTMNWFGYSGWRLLLILEAVPAIVLGIIAPFYLTDRPKEARWLPDDERAWLTQELEREIRDKKAVQHLTVWQAFRHREVLLLTLSYFLVTTASYGFNLWLPQIVQRLSGLGVLQVTLVSAIPFLAAFPAMLLIGWHSDKTGERRWHAAFATLLIAIGLGLSQFAGKNLPLAIAMFSITAMGMYSYNPAFFALPTTFLSESTAAASFGFMNSIANLGGFVGPYMVGLLSERTGTFSAGVFFLVGSAAMSGVVLAFIRHTRPLSRTASSDRA